MHLNRSISSALAILLAASALGCSDQGPRWEVEVIEEVAIIGAIRNVARGQTIQFEGRAITNLDRRADEAIIWSVSDQAILSVTSEMVTVGGSVVNRATVTGLNAGGADLIATAEGKKAQVRVNVTAPPP